MLATVVIRLLSLVFAPPVHIMQVVGIGFNRYFLRIDFSFFSVGNTGSCVQLVVGAV